MDGIRAHTYLSRYHAANKRLKEANIPVEITDLHHIFFLITEDGYPEKYEEAHRLLEEYISRYGKAPEWHTQEELDALLMQEAHLPKPNIAHLRILLAGGANLYTRNERFDITAWHYLCQQGNEEAICLALEYGADPNCWSAHWKATAWMTALKRVSVEQMQKLLDHGMDPMLESGGEGNYFHLSIYKNNLVDYWQLLSPPTQTLPAETSLP